MVRASEKVRAKKIMPRACPSFQKAWLDRAELLKTPGSRAQIRAEPRLDPALPHVRGLLEGGFYFKFYSFSKFCGDN